MIETKPVVGVKVVKVMKFMIREWKLYRCRISDNHITFTNLADISRQFFDFLFIGSVIFFKMVVSSFLCNYFMCVMNSLIFQWFQDCFEIFYFQNRCMLDGFYTEEFFIFRFIFKNILFILLNYTHFRSVNLLCEHIL